MNSRPAAAAILFVLFSITFVHSEDSDRPNILFAISDDQSWMHCGAYGDPSIQTPAFDRLAREGVLFTHAFCASPSCAPSRAAILTGRNIWELEEAGNLFGILKSKYRPFTLDLRDAGYELAATGKTWGPGQTEGISLFNTNRTHTDSRNSIFGSSYSKIKNKVNKRGINSTDYAANFEDFLKKRDPKKPFFFWYGATEPHQNYDVGGWKSSGKKLSQALLPACIPDSEVTRGEFLDYSLEIEHFDRHLGKMLELLETVGELDNTLVVVTSDHGNPMPRSKCNLYDSGTRVPLAVRWPKKIVGRRKVNGLVSLVDLGSTILNAAGIQSPKRMSGNSLWPILTSSKETVGTKRPNFVVMGFERHIICRQNGFGYPMRAIRTKDFSYIRNYEPDRWPAGDPDFNSSHQGFYGDCDRGESKNYILNNAQSASGAYYYRLCFGRRPAEELYSIQDDPHQLKNLAADPSYEKVKQDLKNQLVAYLKETSDPRQTGKSPWDDYPFTDRRIFNQPDWKQRGFPIQPPRNRR